MNYYYQYYRLHFVFRRKEGILGTRIETIELKVYPHSEVVDFEKAREKFYKKNKKLQEIKIVECLMM